MDDLEQLVHVAAKGDPNAFVELTRRFQHFAFGSALALLGDFQQAEDSVQEAFLAAWSCRGAGPLQVLKTRGFVGDSQQASSVRPVYNADQPITALKGRPRRKSRGRVQGFEPPVPRLG